MYIRVNYISTDVFGRICLIFISAKLIYLKWDLSSLQFFFLNIAPYHNHNHLFYIISIIPAMTITQKTSIVFFFFIL